MEAQLKRFVFLLPAALLISLTACKGVGIGELNTRSPLEESKEDKADNTWWEHFYGQKSSSPESKAWRDYYKAPNAEEIEKPRYCGFWGSCSGKSEYSSNCDFYGNCPTKPSTGW